MNMSGYTKLFNSILASTIWREDDKTRIVWITMLAMASKDGEVEASIPGLADFARVSIDDCRSAIKKLMAPDPDSRCKDYDGRRIEEIDGGWIILNHERYRAKMGEDERREYNRIKQAERRQRLSANVKHVNDESALSAQAEADTKALVLPLSPSFTPGCCLNTPEFLKAWNDWKTFRRQSGKKLTAIGEDRQVKMLLKLGVENAIRSIEQSIEKGWTGLFEPHENSSRNTPKPNPRNDGCFRDPTTAARTAAAIRAQQ